MCDIGRERAVRNASNRFERCTPTHDDRYISPHPKKNVSRLTEERVIKFAAAKDLRE